MAAGRSVICPRIQPNLLLQQRPQAERSQNLNSQSQPLSAETQNWAIPLLAGQMRRAILSACLPGSDGLMVSCVLRKQDTCLDDLQDPWGC